MFSVFCECFRFCECIVFSAHVYSFLRVYCVFCECFVFSASVFDMCILFDLYGPP